jgi:hypothetical protein
VPLSSSTIQTQCFDGNRKKILAFDGSLRKNAQMLQMSHEKEGVGEEDHPQKKKKEKKISKGSFAWLALKCTCFQFRENEMFTVWPGVLGMFLNMERKGAGVSWML